MPNNIDNMLSAREQAEQNTARTSMSLYKSSTVYDKKSFELSATTRSTSLPFPSPSMFKLPNDNDKLAFTIPFNSIYRRLLDNDLYNERLLCVVNGGDPFYGANLINNLCAVLSSSADTYVCCPQVKSQEVSVVRQSDATIEEAMKNKLGYNFAYHQRLIDNGTLSTAKYEEYLDYLKTRLSASVTQAERFIRYVPSNVHFVSFYEGRYYFGTNHGLFMSENPFLDNALCSQASVVWPYGYNDGEKFVDDDTYDALHAGLFNYSAVNNTVLKTMLGADVYGMAYGDPTAELEDMLPQFDVFALLPVTFNLSSEKPTAPTSCWHYDVFVLDSSGNEPFDPTTSFDALDEAIEYCEEQKQSHNLNSHIYYVVEFEYPDDVEMDKWGPDGYERGGFVWSSNPDDQLVVTRPLSSVEAVVCTSHGLWALINRTRAGLEHSLSTDEIEGWEEDQVSSAIVSYDWVQIDGTCTNPDNDFIDLSKLSVTSIARSEEDPTVFYLGTPKGMFSCKFNTVYKMHDEYGSEVWKAAVDFNYVYGYYDASISSLVYVHPSGYDGSVLAGTDYGVLQAANSWFPDVDSVYGGWLSAVDFNQRAVTAVGVQSSGAPRLVGLSSASQVGMYKINDDNDGLANAVYDGEVHGIYGDVIDGAWTIVAWKPADQNGPNRVEILSVAQSNDPPVLHGENVVNHVPNCDGIRKCMVSTTGSIYFTVSGAAGKENAVYQLSRRRQTGENVLDMNEYVLPEKVIGFAVTANDKLSADFSHDAIFVATVSSVYAFISEDEVEENFFVPTRSMSHGGSNVRVVGHATFSEMNAAEIMFYQDADGTYAGFLSDFEYASDDWTKIDDIGFGTAVDDTVTSLCIRGYGRIVVTRGGVYNVGLKTDNSLWFGKSEEDPSPVIAGDFTGAVLLDDVDRIEGGATSSDVKLLLLMCCSSGSGKTLKLYSVNPARNSIVSEDQIDGFAGSHVVLSPFNNAYQLSALAVKGNALNSVTARKSSTIIVFDPSTSEQDFTEIDINV